MASRLVLSLKALSKKLNSAGKEAKGDTVDAVVEDMANNFDLEGGGEAITITAINLTATSAGVVTGGTCTFSNGESIDITVTNTNT